MSRLHPAHPVPPTAHPAVRGLDRPPVADKRPAILVVALLAGLLTALVVPALRDYFGLTRPAGIVYVTVLPVLLWLLALAAAYRFRLMDRLLGLQDLLKD